MKTSLKWLNEYLDQPVNAIEAEEILTAVGFPLDGVESLPDGDHQLDVEVTSNRGDCLSHIGLAREIAAATGRTLVRPEVTLPGQHGPVVDTLTTVDLEAEDLCYRFTARVIRGVRVGPSPDWLVRHLEAVGLRSVNNVVDVTNYVMLEMGQPLHAFDQDQLAEGRIVVRRGRAGEKFAAIDGSKHTLDGEMLVIADAEKAVAIAGVMGGLESEVGEATTNILIEAAQFAPLSVRTTSRKLKLASDASYRFERGINIAGIDLASQRAAQLILKLAGGKLAEGVIFKGTPRPEPIQLTLRPERCNGLLGSSLGPDQMIDYLMPLGLDPRLDAGLIHCTVPPHRLDLTREVDLIEEVARLRGLDAVEVEEKMHIVARRPQRTVLARRVAGEVLQAHGYYETITFSTLSEKAASYFASKDQLVCLDDERNRADPALRPSLLPSLLQVRKLNQDAGNHGVRLFEIASVFAQGKSQYAQSRKLSLLADADGSDALRELRGTLEEMLAALGHGQHFEIRPATDLPAWAEVAAEIVTSDDPTPLGVYGKVNAKTLDAFDLKIPVLLGELDYARLIGAYPAAPQVHDLPRFPPIERDLSVVVDESTAWQKISKAINSADPALLEGVAFVTTYRGKQVGAGKKSVTFRMTFRDPEKTLRHDEVDPQVAAVVEKLKAEVQAELRA